MNYNQTSIFIFAIVFCALAGKFFVKMYQSQSHGSRMKPRVQITTVQDRSYHKFQNVIIHKNKSCQTIKDNSCEDHTKQITQLLTEVAIVLGQNAKLENQIVGMKEEILSAQHESNESRLGLEQEVEKLKRENFEKEVQLSKLKITHLEEQKSLLTQVSNLKSEIKNSNEDNDIAYQNLIKEKEQLVIEMNVHKDDLKREVEKNMNLQFKVTKYKNKLKYMVNFIQQFLHDSKDKIENDDEKKLPTNIPNVEDLVLTELFFKPPSLPVEIEEIFFHQQG